MSERLLDAATLGACALCPPRLRREPPGGRGGRLRFHRSSASCPGCPAFLGGAAHLGRGGLGHHLF